MTNSYDNDVVPHIDVEEDPEVVATKKEDKAPPKPPHKPEHKAE